MAMIIIAFTILRGFSQKRACVQFAREKSHINNIEGFWVCMLRAPLARAVKGGGLNLMDAPY